LLHTIQLRALDAVDELIDAGVPDLREARLAERIRAVADRYGEGITGLPALLDGLDDRLTAVRRCGLPDTLAHEDFHPGNVRNLPGGGSPPVILDWGDAFIGHPAFDILRMVDDLDPAAAKPLLDLWQERWRASAPGSDPATALRLLRPVAALLHAVVYANFLANIEPSEHPYHAADVPDQLTAAVKGDSEAAHTN
jgi:aminoglycoside phosphotransferase (APT) family kinase protein